MKFRYMSNKKVAMYFMHVVMAVISEEKKTMQKVQYVFFLFSDGM